MNESVFMLDLSRQDVPIKECCSNIIQTIFDESDTERYIHCAQNSQTWLEARKFRITGSRCYEIFTYSRNDWDNKALKYFYPKSIIKNKYISHGLKYENDARRAFISLTGTDVREFGFVVPKNNIWLGYSPDGVIFEHDKPVALLEIKCIFAGNI